MTGNVCENGDVLAADVELPEVREGDRLAFLDAGAYGFVMASTYNLRPLPAEVLLRRDGEAELIRGRGRVEDLLG